MRTMLLGLALALNSPLPAQQLVAATNDNPSYGGYAVGWPASVLAFRFTANTPVLAAAQVFTGNQPPASHSLEIRTRHATTGLPDQLLGQPGSWLTTHTRSFQGALFAQPANVTPGQDYFLVWRVQGMFHQHSVSADTEPSNVPVEVRVSDGSTWHAQAQLPAKFRLFAPYAAGSTGAVFGNGKPGQYGVPTIGVHGWPALGSPLDFWLGSASRNTLAVLVLGTAIPGGAPVGFADLYVTPDALLTALTRTHTNPLSGGIASTLMVPDTPTAIGFALAAQWGVFDPQAADGFSHSAAIGVVIQ
jgi:hypothetical protein